MKKVLISDYDDTFFTNEEQIKRNIYSINNFRKDENIFIIATARSLKSINEEIKKYKIECDYIISDMGAIILRKFDNHIIFENYMSYEQVSKIEKELKNYANINIYRFRSLDNNKKEEDIIGYKIKSECPEKLCEIKNKLESNNNNLILRLSNSKKLFILNKKNTKIKAIEILLSELNLDKKNIYTIGDSDDDLEMLKCYNGFRMEKSSETLKLQIPNTVEEVYQLVNEITDIKSKV